MAELLQFDESLYNKETTAKLTELRDTYYKVVASAEDSIRSYICTYTIIEGSDNDGYPDGLPLLDKLQPPGLPSSLAHEELDLLVDHVCGELSDRLTSLFNSHAAAIAALQVISPERLRLLAKWLDKTDNITNTPSTDVQHDLNRLADTIESALVAAVTGEPADARPPKVAIDDESVSERHGDATEDTREAAAEDTAARFRRLAKQWRTETQFISSTTQIIEHPVHKEIVKMGEYIVPLLLDELEQNGGHWFGTYIMITGATSREEIEVESEK